MRRMPLPSSLLPASGRRPIGIAVLTPLSVVYLLVAAVLLPFATSLMRVDRPPSISSEGR